MKSKYSISVVAALAAIFISSLTLSCGKKGQDPIAITDSAATLTPYTIIAPAHFPQMKIPADNQPYKERVALGRALYYDPILSNDGRSCSSCHFQEYGFTILNTVDNTSVLPHVNLAWNTHFMWDGSKYGTLEDVMIFETEEFFSTNLVRMNASDKYRELFKKCYNVDTISYKEIGYALAQFTRTMISRDSKYDRYVLGLEQLSYDEEQGRHLFFSEDGDCFHCHSNIITTDNELHNTGLDSTYQKDADKGHYNVTNNVADLGKFKTPNLRNVALRASFMHDGRFKTLEEVVDFYNDGVHKVNNIDPVMLKPGKEDGLNLTELEKKQLVAFLKTFTDSTFLTDPEFSRP